MKRVTLIGDDDLCMHILDEIVSFGASGYTYYTVQGRGQWGGVRPRHAKPPNAKIEVIATNEVAHRILDHVGDNYIGKYAMIAYLDGIEVLEDEKFEPLSGTQRPSGNHSPTT